MRWLVILLLVVLVGWTAIAARRFLKRPPVVDVVSVERGDLTRVLAVTGRIRPLARNQIAAIVAGRLVELRKEEGDPVVAGEVLARLDARRAADLERARAELETARLEVESRRDGIESLRRAVASLEVRLDDYVLRAPLSGVVLRRPVARALMNRPRLVLADEPTGNLGGDNSRDLMALLRQVASAEDTAFLISTHDHDIATSCDRQIHLVDGRIV